VDLARQTAWLNRTENGTSRDVPLNADAVAVLEEPDGKHPQFCFTYRGTPIRWDVTNTARHNALEIAGLSDVRFHDLRHTWGVMASAGWDKLRRAEGSGGMEVAQHDGSVREVCDRKPDVRGGKD
jgi:integrase